nr:transcriptional transactivator [Hepatitis B virus]
MQWNSTTFHQALLEPRVRGLYFPAGGSSSGTVNPVPTTASPISSIFSRTGDPAPNMENTTSGFLGPLLVLQAGFFLLTRKTVRAPRVQGRQRGPQRREVESA